MNKLFLLGFLIIVSCGKDSGSSNNDSGTTTSTAVESCKTDSLLVGEWEHNTISNVDANIKSNCIINTNYCGSTRTISQTTSELNKFTYLTMVVASSNGNDGCLGVGTYKCLYSVYEASGTTQLSFNCGYGTAHYTKINQ